MDPKSVELILAQIDKIALKLGSTAEHVWPWFIRQEYIDSVLSFLLLLIISFVNFKLLRFVCAHWNPEDYDSYSIYGKDHEPVYIFIMILSGCVNLICAIYFILDGFDWLNPEYNAFYSLVSMFQTIK